ncbi:ATP-dependent nuclease [Psychrobacter sp. I-STPA6b]|uniref:ATP-dependent nuclease n=1 Tax=Psychrobacter sp. I-STPA6b TaxID=2585718 RepID=UPI001D0C46CC|nr:AAA family ATPase [Psychrobacter sp. I-STPA6b]
MYIANIDIQNFRNFKKNSIEFNDGINVIIGHNNAGKSNLLRALRLVLDYGSTKRLSINDFNKDASLEDLKAHSPKVSITVTIKKGQTSNEDDLVTISEWLTELNQDYEAKLTYEYFLPESHEEDYSNQVKEIIDAHEVNGTEGDKLTDKELKEVIYKLIQHEFLRRYTHRIWGGLAENQNQADSDLLRKFDFQFLDAIRDVERDLVSGRNVMLKEVLHFFLDYDIKSSDDSDEDKARKIKTKSQTFSEKSAELIGLLDDRIKEGKSQILSYAKQTGASLKSMPSFAGETSDIEMLSFLKLIIEDAGFNIPASHNGLGYNNLIYISILLAKMQADADKDYLGSNSKVFPMLAIEEPEAHLHPSMQDKFLKFLRGNIGNNKVRQIFITSHSTHVTSATELDEIICLHDDFDGNTRVGYLGKVFSDNDEDIKSKKYIKRFLDATKSNMLFAEKIILVEGIAEQLLMSVLAEYENIFLEDHHIAVINLGGRYFDHFLKLFDVTKNASAVLKKVVCLTDIDPVKKSSNGNYKACYPFEYQKDDSNFKDHASELVNTYANHKNIRFFSQNNERGKTFEYDLVLHNPKCEMLITDSMSNKGTIKDMMQLDEASTIEEYYDLLGSSSESDSIKEGIESLGNDWSDDDKKRAIIASRYLNSIGKGENALELAYVLKENLQVESRIEFNVPEYIREALKWIIK